MLHDGAMDLTPSDMEHLRRCVELAEESLEARDEPFGSVLANEKGEVLFEDRNRVAGGDATAHPEIAIAQWALANLDPQERASSTVYTSGEHCPMCSAAHGWAGLGRIVYVASASMFEAWQGEWGAARGPVAALPAEVVVPGLFVQGPVDELVPRVRYLHFRAFQESSQHAATQD